MDPVGREGVGRAVPGTYLGRGLDDLRLPDRFPNIR